MNLLRWTTALTATLAIAGVTACTAALGYGTEVTEVSVVVLNFDPVLDGTRASRLGKDMGWNEPRALADSLRIAVWATSTRKVAYRVVDWRDIDAFPATAGPGWEPDAYRACVEDGQDCRDPRADIPAILDRYGVPPLIDRDIADEVWIFAPPATGIAGAGTAGPGAVEVDAAYPGVAVSRPFAVMGFQLDEGMDDVLHAFCRRVEATVGRALAATEEGARAWARFTAIRAEADTAGVGTCDTPPNATEPGDYDNTDPFPSTAPRWLVYPSESTATQDVSAQVWNGPDYRRTYLRWWLVHLPHNERTPPTSPPSNWWPLAFFEPAG